MMTGFAYAKATTGEKDNGYLDYSVHRSGPGFW